MSEPTRYEQDIKAVSTGWKDGLLTLGFTVAGQIIAYVITLLPFLDTVQQGRWAWLKVPAGLVLAAILKGIDRKIHEDSTSRTGLVKV